jgi:aldose 1-epimerase
MKKLLLVLFLACNFACQQDSKDEFESSFGKLPDGREVKLFTLKNKNGITVKITNWGATVVSVLMPDKNNVFEDVVLGFDSLKNYETNPAYFGCVVGRYGNRIAKGKFKLDGAEYTLATNNDPNHLHGGKIGFDKVLWKIEPSKEANTLTLSYLSKDGEEGYPGNLKVQVKYALLEDNTLDISYSATTDKATPVNLTNHTYFNLSGNTKKNVLNHELYLNSQRHLPVDATLIPTGELATSAGTPFNFYSGKKIGTDIGLDDPQLKIAGGFDHCHIFEEHQEAEAVASIFDDETGRYVECFSTEPAVQFYSGNFLNGSIVGKGNVKLWKNYGMCLETQHYPDSPNQSAFPNTILKPGETYQSKTSYKFLVRVNMKGEQ